MLQNCKAQRVTCVPVPEGCVPGPRGSLKRVKSPFDWILGLWDRVAFIDTKTMAKPTIGFSDLTEHQVEQLFALSVHKQSAGYLVWHRDVNKIVFYPARMLVHLQKGKGYRWDQGILLGDASNFNLSKIWSSGPFGPV